jgi:hypothetical protein
MKPMRNRWGSTESHRFFRSRYKVPYHTDRPGKCKQSLALREDRLTERAAPSDPVLAMGDRFDYITASILREAS